MAPSYFLIPGLPNEISRRVCTFADETPEFVHLEFQRGAITFAKADRVSTVTRTHKALRQTPERYTNSSRSTEADKLVDSSEALEGQFGIPDMPGFYDREIKELIDRWKRDCVPEVVGLSPFSLCAGGERISMSGTGSG